MFFILGVICVVSSLLAAGYLILIEDEPKSGGTLFFAGLAVGAVLIVISCCTVVPTGHTGVVTTFGRVENRTLDAGPHFLAPWTSVVDMDNRVQKETIELSCFSSDIQEVSMVYTVNYQINKANAMTIYSTVGKDYYKKTVLPAVMESIKIVAAKYTAESLVGSRNELAEAIETDLAGKLINYNIELVSTSIEDMDFTEAFTQAVEAKQVAAQNKLKAETEAAQRVLEANAAAEIKKLEAEANAYEATVKAKAEAEAMLLIAEAEATANKKIADSLTETLINYTYANGWDGKLPTYMVGENSVPMLQLN